MDDLVTSVPSQDEATQLVSQLQQLFALLDMEIKKWGSSHSDVLTGIPAEDRAKALDVTSLGSSPQSGMMALGMRWLTTSDTFVFTMDAPRETNWTPKRCSRSS